MYELNKPFRLKSRVVRRPSSGAWSSSGRTLSFIPERVNFSDSFSAACRRMHDPHEIGRGSAYARISNTSQSLPNFKGERITLVPCGWTNKLYPSLYLLPFRCVSNYLPVEGTYTVHVRPASLEWSRWATLFHLPFPTQYRLRFKGKSRSDGMDLFLLPFPLLRHLLLSALVSLR